MASNSLTLSRAEERVRDLMSQGKTPAVIAKELSGDERYGYSPEEVYAIISRILESLDAYSLDQQLKLSILDLREMASEAKDNYSSTGNAQHLRGAVEALDKAMTHMEALQSKSEDLLTTLDQKQADFLVSLVERSFDRTLGELSARFPLVEKAELETLFRSHLTVVAREADNAV